MSAETLPQDEPGKEYSSSWFALTPNRLLATLGALRGEINCDICVIGGGFTGLSAALELSKKGYSVTLLEARAITDSASGKNGGHILRGFTRAPGRLERKFGPATAKALCNLTLEGLALVIERIAKHDIKCDLKFGHVTTALTPDHAAVLKQSIRDWEKIGHTDLSYLKKSELSGFVQSPKYTGGLLDPKGAHFHPLNYALGMAQAAQAHACKIYDETPVLSIQKGSPATVVTEQGKVSAKFIVLGGHISLKGFERLNKKVYTATAHMVATEPLSANIVQKILPRNPAVTEAGPEMNYFRLSADNRLLFGGDSLSGAPDDALKKRMSSIFPALTETGIAHCWRSPTDITLNRMPDMGRLAPNIFYAHGYSGHNIVLGNLAGWLIAEALSGTAGKFDVFAKIRHISLIGGSPVKRPVFALGAAWHRLQDLLF